RGHFQRLDLHRQDCSARVISGPEKRGERDRGDGGPSATVVCRDPERLDFLTAERRSRGLPQLADRQPDVEVEEELALCLLSGNAPHVGCGAAPCGHDEIGIEDDYGLGDARENRREEGVCADRLVRSVAELVVYRQELLVRGL